MPFKKIIRSIILMPNDPESALIENYVLLLKSGIRPELESHVKLLTWIEGFYRSHNTVPHKDYLLHLTKNAGDENVAALLLDIDHDTAFIGGAFKELLRELSATQERENFRGIIEKNWNAIVKTGTIDWSSILTDFAAQAQKRRASNKFEDTSIKATLNSFRARKQQRIYSMIEPLDLHTGGFRAEELVSLAAPTGQGKSSFALNLAYIAALQGYKVLFVSLEMSMMQLHPKIASIHRHFSNLDVGFNYRDFIVGDVTEQQLCSLEGCLRHMETELSGCLQFSVPIGAYTVANLTGDIITMAHADKKPDMVVVDYLNELTPQRKTDRHLEIAEMVRSLKTIARMYNLTVLCLSQINREGSKKSDEGKAVGVYHAFESSAIEHGSDHFIILSSNDEDRAQGVMSLSYKKGRLSGPLTAPIKISYSSDTCVAEYKPAIYQRALLEIREGEIDVMQ